MKQLRFIFRGFWAIALIFIVVPFHAHSQTISNPKLKAFYHLGLSSNNFFHTISLDSAKNIILCNQEFDCIYNLMDEIIVQAIDSSNFEIASKLIQLRITKGLTLNGIKSMYAESGKPKLINSFYWKSIEASFDSLNKVFLGNLDLHILLKSSNLNYIDKSIRDYYGNTKGIEKNASWKKYAITMDSINLVEAFELLKEMSATSKSALGNSCGNLFFIFWHNLRVDNDRINLLNIPFTEFEYYLKAILNKGFISNEFYANIIDRAYMQGNTKQQRYGSIDNEEELWSDESIKKYIQARETILLPKFITHR